MLNGGIYQIKNIINGKVYIGSAKEFERRWGSHLYELKKNSHTNPHLQRSFNKHGEQNFTFEKLKVLGKYDKDVYFAIENIYIEKALKTELCYNIAKAEGGWTYHTKERKAEIVAKMSKSLKLHLASLSKEEKRKKYGWSIGISRTEEEKQKISKKLKGVSKSLETRKKMSESSLGIPKSLEARKKMSESKLGKQPWNHGRKFSAETKEKMRKAKIGKPLSEDHKAKLRLAAQKRRITNIKINGVGFESVAIAAIYYSKSISWVYNHLKKEKLNE